jgi:hypothetical protein
MTATARPTALALCDPDAIRTYFRLLYGNRPPGQLAVMGWVQGRINITWAAADDLERLILAAQQLAARTDVYHNVATRVAALEKGARGGSDDTLAAPGLYIDIDYVHPAHSEQNLPPSLNDALAIVRRFPLPPTMLVHSAHGLHGWWLGKEPWVFAMPAERQAAQDLTRRFQATFRAYAQTEGWSLDNTSDLARILRPAGTVNHKLADDLQPVTILELNDGSRYDPDDFEPFLLEVPYHAEPTGNGVNHGQLHEPGVRAWKFIATGAPVGHQREEAVAVARALLAAGYAIEDAADLVWKGLQASRCSRPAEPWAYADALAIVRDLSHRDAPPLAEQLHGTNGANGSTTGSSGNQGGPQADGRVHAVRAEAPWPEPLAEEAFYGFAGRAIRAISPYSEADPAALLANVLSAFGAFLGKSVYAYAADAEHPAKLFAVVVGATSKGRKGSAARPIERILSAASLAFVDRMTEGLSSGEGLIHQVRDAVSKMERVGKGPDKTTELVEVDPGIADKRLWVQESEFASTLRVATRDGSTLTAIIRRMWDRADVASLTKVSPSKTTGSHVAITGHVTKEELLRYLDRTELANGFANRFLWFASRRGRILPDGEGVPLEIIESLAEELSVCKAWTQSERVLRRDAEASEIWRTVYEQLSEGGLGMFGMVTNRAEAQVLRISVFYAILDRSDVIRAPHLLAAIAVWRYCEQSVRWIFGDATGDPNADTILAALRQNGPMRRVAIFDLFGRHISQDRLSRALTLLLTGGLARCERRTDTGGAPAEEWSAT